MFLCATFWSINVEGGPMWGCNRLFVQWKSFMLWPWQTWKAVRFMRALWIPAHSAVSFCENTTHSWGISAIHHPHTVYPALIHTPRFLENQNCSSSTYRMPLYAPYNLFSLCNTKLEKPLLVLHNLRPIGVPCDWLEFHFMILIPGWPQPD